MAGLAGHDPRHPDGGPGAALSACRREMETCTAKVIAAIQLAEGDRLLPLAAGAQERSLEEWIDLLSKCLKDLVATNEDLQTDNQVMRSDLKRIRNNTEASALALGREADAARAEAARAEGSLIAARKELERCETEKDCLRAEILRLRKETDAMQRSFEDGQARLADADISAHVGQQHLSLAERSLEEMHMDLQKAKRERDTWRAQAQRQKAAFQDEVRVAHEKLIELQRLLSSETDARRAAQDKLKQSQRELRVQREERDEADRLRRSAESKLKESTLHISHHEDDLRRRQDSQRLIEHLENQLSDARAQLAVAKENCQRAIEDHGHRVSMKFDMSTEIDTSVLRIALRDALQMKESLEASLSTAQGEIGALRRTCHELDESNQLLTHKQYESETQLTLLKEQFSNMSAEVASANHLRRRVAEMEQDTGLWQEGMAREAAARRKSGSITLRLIEELLQIKGEIDAVMRSVRADMAKGYDLRMSDMRKMDSMKTLIGMHVQSERQSQALVSDAISALEDKLELTVEATKQTTERYRASLGEHSAKIEYLYLALEGTEAAEKDSRAQSGELRVAVENLQSELEEISARYETIKGEKQRVDGELQSKSRALEALEQENQDEVKRGVAREKRIHSVSAEINDLDERLGREISARHKAKLETEEIATKLVAANNELQYLRTKLDEVETLCSQLQETKLQMQLEVTDCTSKLKSAEEENQLRRSTADVLREELEDEVKRNKELQSNLHRKSRALEEAYNDLSLLQHEKKTTDGAMSDLQAKLDSTNSSLMNLQAVHQGTKEEHDRIAMRLSSAERVEADVRVKLDRVTARAIHLEQQLYDEAEKVAELMAKVDDFERTIKMVMKRVDDFQAGTERTIAQYKSQNAALHQKSADNVAANAKYKSELRCLDAELQQANQRSQSFEVSLRQVLEDSAKFGEAFQERTLRDQQNFENILEQLCVAIDPSAFVISSRPTPSLSFSRRKSEENCSAGEKEDVKHLECDDYEQEEADAEWKVEGYVAGGDTSLIEALCVQEPKSWSEIGAAASEKAVQINDELRQLKVGKDQLNHSLQVREEEVEVLSVTLEKVQRDLISSEAREKDHIRRADELSKDLVALKEEQKSLKARLIESRDKNSELESVVDASCKDQLMLKMQWDEAKKELEDAKVRVEELEEQHRDDGKQKLRLQLEVDAKGCRLEQLEKDLTLCQMQLKESNYEKDEAIREVEHRKSDAFQAHSQLAEAKNTLRISAEEKMSQQKRHEDSIAHKNEMIEGLRQEMVAARQEIVAVREGQDKLRGEVNMLENERETLRTELADLKLQLTMTLERETVLKDKILENEERGAQILQAKKQRIENLLEEAQAAEHALVLAEAETDKTKLELKTHIELLEEERGKTHDLRSAIEQAALREERLLSKSGHLKELHEDDTKAIAQRDDQITKLEDQLFAVTKRMHEVHWKHENAEAEWKYRHEDDTAQLAEKAKRLEHLTDINKKMYVAICGEDMPEFFQYTGISDNFYHHSELASNKALSQAVQMRANFKNARTQVESIQRSILNQDDYKSDKIRQYEDQIWALTVQIKEIQDEKQENSIPDEFSTKRIEMLEEEVSIKSEQLASSQSRLVAAKQELSEKHEQNLEHVKRIGLLEDEISIKNAKVDTVLDKCLVGTDLVFQTLMHVQTALHYENGRAQATEQSLRQAAYEQLYREGETISAMMDQVEAYEEHVMMTQNAVNLNRAREQSALREMESKCKKLEDDLSESRLSVARLQEECVQLASEVKESSNRSLVMEIGLQQVLEDSKKFAGTREELSYMQKDIASAFALIQNLCASIEEPSRTEDSLLEAISGDIFGTVAGQDLRKRGVEACNRVVAMHSELMQVKAKVIELQDLNRKLSAEVDNASNRSVVMEVMAKEALDESKRYEDQKLRFQMLEKDLENACQMLEKDLENAFVYIQKLCTAIHGKESQYLGETARSEATGRNTFSVVKCAMACSMACESAQNLHTELSQLKANQAHLEVQHQEHIQQRGRLRRAVHEMEAVSRRAEQSILRHKQENAALKRKAYGGKLSIKVQLMAKTAQCETLQTMLDDFLSSKDISQSVYGRESLLLRHQLERISFDFDFVVRDLKETIESSLYREADLKVQIDEYRIQQKVLSFMMERIWFAIAAQAEGPQAWRYFETAMEADQVSQVSQGLPERADEICRVIAQMRDRLVAYETEADAKNDLIASQAHEVDQVNARFTESDEIVEKLKEDLAETRAQLQQSDDKLQSSQEQCKRLDEELQRAKDALLRTEDLLTARDVQLQETETLYSNVKHQLESAKDELEKRAEQLTEKDLLLETRSNQCSTLENDLAEATVQLHARAGSLAQQLQDADERFKQMELRCSVAENEIQRLQTLLAQEQEDKKELQALSTLLSEKDEVLTWLLEELEEGMYLTLDLHQQREAIGTCADDTINALGTVLGKFRHLQETPWLSRPAVGAPGKSSEKGFPEKLQSERKNKAKDLATSFFKDDGEESSGSDKETPSHGSRSAPATASSSSAPHGRSSAVEAPGAGRRDGIRQPADASLGSLPKEPTSKSKAVSPFQGEESHQPLMEKVQGLVSELQRAFEMLRTSVSDDMDYYREIFGLVIELDQDLEKALKQFIANP